NVLSRLARSALRHALQRALEEADDRPAAQHAQQVDGRDQQRQGRGNALVEITEGDAFVILHGEKPDGSQHDQENEETEKSHRSSPGSGEKAVTSGAEFPHSCRCCVWQVRNIAPSESVHRSELSLLPWSAGVPVFSLAFCPKFFTFSWTAPLSSWILS